MIEPEPKSVNYVVQNIKIYINDCKKKHLKEEKKINNNQNEKKNQQF